MNRIRVAIDVVTGGARKSLQDFKKQVSDAEGATAKLSAGWAGMGNLVKQNALALAGGLAAVTGAAFKMAQGAAETEAAFASLNQIAGETIANDVAGWAEDAVEKFGLSDRALFSYSKSLANVGASIGQTEAEMRSFIESHLKLAADFAAFADTSPDKVMQDLMSAYAGSSEVLLKYGVFANETSLKNLLLAETGEKITGTLTAQQRVLGINLALKQKHLDIDGQWNRESDELAGQQARLSATLTNISDAVGKAILPAFVELADVINDNAAELEAFAEAAGEAVGQIGGLVGEVKAFKESLTDVPLVGPALEGWWDWLSPKAWTKHVDDARNYLARDMEALGRRIGGVFGLAADDVTMSADEIVDSLGEIDRAARGRAAPGLKRLADEEEAAAAAARDLERETDRVARRLDAQADAHRGVVEAARDQREIVDDLIGLQARLIGGELGVQDAQQRATEALREYEEAAANGARSAEKLLRLQQSVVDAERGADSADDAVVAAKRAEDEADRRLQEARRRDADDDEIARLEENARKARDKVYSAEDQARNADRAIDEARRRVAEEERKASPEELAELQRRATQAQLDAARAASQYEADLKRANGETVNAAEETRLFQQALGDAGAALAPGSPLRQGLEQYIGLLDTVIQRERDAQQAMEDRIGALANASLSQFEALQQRGQGRFQAPFAVRGSAPTSSSTTNIYVAPPSGPQFVKADLRDYERRNGSDR